MKTGFIGLGKLGLPASVAMTFKGHEVYAYDIDERKRQMYSQGSVDLYEPDIEQRLEEALKNGLHIVDSVQEVVSNADIIFIAVPTPSKSEGSFETQFVQDAVSEIGARARNIDRYLNIVIISTILPGTIRNTIKPVLEKSSGKIIGKNIGLCYNASFIAMGTTIEDFLDPEFVLIGESDPKAGNILANFYENIVSKNIPRLHMSWENAEVVKMAYNTMIGFKIVYANSLMELCNSLPTGDVDVVSNALSNATRRIVGARYLRGGMGDGGACHPRDNIALSWLNEKLGLSANPFEFVMQARHNQAGWLANILRSYNLPIVILGVRYKPNTNLTDYSASLLVDQILRESGKTPHLYDPLTSNNLTPPSDSSVYLIALEDNFIHDFEYISDSVIIDPWRCFTYDEVRKLKKRNILYVPIGRKSE